MERKCVLMFGLYPKTDSEQKESMITMLSKIRKWIAVFGTMAIVLALVGCNNGFGESQPSTDDSTKQETPGSLGESGAAGVPAGTVSANDIYRAVLAGEKDFIIADTGESLTIGQIKETVTEDEDVAVSIVEFTVLDLDGDGVPEVLLSLQINSGAGAVVIMRCQDMTIYGYTAWYREFSDLKQDGTFSFSSGASNNGFGRIRFENGDFTVDRIAYVESSYDSDNNKGVSYFVNYKSVSEAEFVLALEQQDEKPDARWYAFTEENIEELLDTSENLSEAMDMSDTTPFSSETVSDRIMEIAGYTLVDGESMPVIVRLALLDIERGVSAYEAALQSSNRELEPAQEGWEYILLSVSVEYVSGEADIWI